MSTELAVVSLSVRNGDPAYLRVLKDSRCDVRMVLLVLESLF